MASALSAKVCACLLQKRARNNKAFWTNELSTLKDLSILHHHAWIEAGRPRDGVLCANRNATKLAYKQAIRRARIQYDQQMNERLIVDLLHHNMRKF